jgi:hypothetical protein
VDKVGNLGRRSHMHGDSPPLAYPTISRNWPKQTTQNGNVCFTWVSGFWREVIDGFLVRGEKLKSWPVARCPAWFFSGFQDSSFRRPHAFVAPGSCATPPEAAGVPQVPSPGRFDPDMARAPGWAVVGRGRCPGAIFGPVTARAPGWVKTRNHGGCR